LLKTRFFPEDEQAVSDAFSCDAENLRDFCKQCSEASFLDSCAKILATLIDFAAAEPPSDALSGWGDAAENVCIVLHKMSQDSDSAAALAKHASIQAALEAIISPTSVRQVTARLRPTAFALVNSVGKR
jgi:hypothetical protein